MNLGASYRARHGNPSNLTEHSTIVFANYILSWPHTQSLKKGPLELYHKNAPYDGVAFARGSDFGKVLIDLAAKVR